MSRSKKIFLGAVVLFFVLLFYASYDISTRTTFPGSKPQLKERLQDQFGVADSTALMDSSIHVKNEGGN
jgi:heme/copper-type cytochrome/quinol oxidase subunit 3